jgi:large subunit ribosomal protein L30
MSPRKRKGKKVQQLRLTYAKSSIGYSERQKGTIRALGLRRLGSSVVQPDTPPIRGMIDKVSHLITVEEIEG